MTNETFCIYIVFSAISIKNYILDRYQTLILINVTKKSQIEPFVLCYLSFKGVLKVNELDKDIYQTIWQFF